MNTLVLVAHADDETLGAGGLIQKLVARGERVDVVILSDCVITARSERQDNRPGAIAACARLGLGAPVFLDFPDQRFDTVAMADLAGAVLALGLAPDLVVSHVDTDLNLDHRITAEVARIVGRPKLKPVSILGCEIPNTSFWNGRQFPANYYLDISPYLDTKIEAFCCYANELQDYPHPWSRRGLRALAEYHGMQAGCAAAEAFQVIRAHDGHLP